MLTQVPSGMLQTTAQFYSMKNRIINGAMVIDQRNNGAALNPVVDGNFCVDRFKFQQSLGSKFSTQQLSASPPVGFSNYLNCTSLSAYSVSSTDYFVLSQLIEANNVQDLAWGTANAKTITLSFWIQCSLTGTFSGVIENNGGTRSYPFTYSIPVANTWTYISVSIPGDTSGTWTLSGNTVGVYVRFSLGVGSSNSGTPNTWANTGYLAATGSVNVVGTSGATWNITGVQFEVGTQATSFDYRPYTTELALCQRYLPAFSYGIGQSIGVGANWANGNIFADVFFPVQARTVPTGLTISSGTDVTVFYNGTGYVSTGVSLGGASITTAELNVACSGSVSGGGGCFVRSGASNLLFYLTGCEL